MTIQRGEQLRFEGAEYGLYSFPLGSLAHRLPKPRTLSTDCRRGYVGHWVVEDGRLCLSDLRDAAGDPWPEAWDTLSLPEGKPAPADWFSGELVLGQGAERFMRPSLGIRVFERELRLRFEKGRLIGRESRPTSKGRMVLLVGIRVTWAFLIMLGIAWLLLR